jgi:hypothetical protein
MGGVFMYVIDILQPKNEFQSYTQCEYLTFSNGCSMTATKRKSLKNLLKKQLFSSLYSWRCFYKSKLGILKYKNSILIYICLFMPFFIILLSLCLKSRANTIVSFESWHQYFVGRSNTIVLSYFVHDFPKKYYIYLVFPNEWLFFETYRNGFDWL